MLRALPHSFLSWDFTVYDGDTRVAELDLAWFREKGEAITGDIACKVYREGLVSGAFVLEAKGHRLVQAHKPSAFFRTFDLTCDGARYTLKAKSAFGRTFVLLQGDEEIGSVYPDHPFTRKMTVDLPEDLPLVVRVFIVWLVLILWKRSSDSAAG